MECMGIKYQRKILITALLTGLLILPLVTACSGGAPAKDTRPQGSAADTAPLDNEPDQQGASTEAGDTESEVYPDEVMALLEAIRPLKLGTSIVVGNETYFIVSYGGEDMDGHQAVIKDIKVDSDRVEVTSELSLPSPGKGPGGSGHPYAVEVKEGTFPEVFFQDATGDYIPRLVGVEDEIKPTLEPIKSSDRIWATSFTYDPKLTTISGIAQVFEATVSYQLLDGQDRVLASGFTTAASGGPDWGYFSLEIDDLPAGTKKVALFEESAKDGSPLGKVEFGVGPGQS